LFARYPGGFDLLAPSWSQTELLKDKWPDWTASYMPPRSSGARGLPRRRDGQGRTILFLALIQSRATWRASKYKALKYKALNTCLKYKPRIQNPRRGHQHRQGLVIPQAHDAASRARREPFHPTRTRKRTGPSTKVQSLPRSGREIRPRRYLDAARRHLLRSILIRID
jgi:hypothetical protein